MGWTVCLFVGILSVRSSGFSLFVVALSAVAIDTWRQWHRLLALGCSHVHAFTHYFEWDIILAQYYVIYSIDGGHWGRRG